MSYQETMIDDDGQKQVKAAEETEPFLARDSGTSSLSSDEVVSDRLSNQGSHKSNDSGIHRTEGNDTGSLSRLLKDNTSGFTNYKPKINLEDYDFGTDISHIVRENNSGSYDEPIYMEIDDSKIETTDKSESLITNKSEDMYLHPIPSHSNLHSDSDCENAEMISIKPGEQTVSQSLNGINSNALGLHNSESNEQRERLHKEDEDLISDNVVSVTETPQGSDEQEILPTRCGHVDPGESDIDLKLPIDSGPSLSRYANPKDLFISSSGSDSSLICDMNDSSINTSDNSIGSSMNSSEIPTGISEECIKDPVQVSNYTSETPEDELSRKESESEIPRDRQNSNVSEIPGARQSSIESEIPGVRRSSNEFEIPEVRQSGKETETETSPVLSKEQIDPLSSDIPKPSSQGMEKCHSHNSHSDIESEALVNSKTDKDNIKGVSSADSSYSVFTTSASGNPKMIPQKKYN